MSRYEWPAAGRAEDDDNPTARGRFTRRFRREFDPEGAQEASRKALARHAAPAVKGARSAKAPVSGNSFLWQPLGPMTVTGGQIIGEGRVAGRINMLAVHKDGERVYAASANGGVWYSTTGGKAWVSLGGFAATQVAGIKRPAQRNACGSIEVKFGGTEATDVVYVGTGETTHQFDAQPASSLAGIGILVGQHPATAGVDDPWVREAKNLVGEGVCRIALQPGGNGVVAATTAGLFERPANPPNNGLDCDWTKVQQPPFNDLSDKCCDVLWTKGEAGVRPERLWVWIQDGAKAGLWCRDKDAAEFKSIAPMALLPSGWGPRGLLSRVAAEVSPAQIYATRDVGGPNAPQILRVNSPGMAQPTAEGVFGAVPQIMGGVGQGFYDIAIATNPAMLDRIVIGGSTFPTVVGGVTLLAPGNTDDAGVIVADVALKTGVLTFGQPNPPVQVGVGVHADVHDIVWTNAGNRMWVACDGGVFRSDSPMKPFGFYAANSGLAVIEANYIACHPTCEGFIVAGLQDNGVITFRSSGHWSHDGNGDGGGVVFDALRPVRYFRQFFGGGWTAVPGPGALPALKPERDGAAFYSEAATIAKRRAAPPGPPDVGQLAVGTTRVWYSEDFGTTWFTLPSGSTAAVANATPGIDSLGLQITVLRWQSPEVLWVLGAQFLLRYSRTTDGTPGTWVNPGLLMRPPDAVIPGGKEKKRPPVPPSMNDSTVWTDIAPNLDPPLTPGGPPQQHGTLGALYIGTIGHETKAEVDTLWWFDGTDKWHPTKLRTDAAGVPAPVTAIVCHPEFPLEVWVGTTVGMWHGVRTDHGANPPTWAWTGHVNGLPEAAVEDLEIFKDGSLMLLRAGIKARGVWELRWDNPTLQTLTFVRAHDDDLRHRSPAVKKKRDLVTDRSWHGSPDVRPRRAPIAVPAPATLPWFSGSPSIDAEQLRRFQSALRARIPDPRVQPTGRWDAYFNEVLRDLGAPLAPAPPPPPAPQVPPAGTVTIDNAFWTLSMVPPHDTKEPWGTGLPTEADLSDYALKLEEGDVGQALCTLARQPHKVDVVVHHRGGFAVGGGTVRVTLLKWIDPAPTNAAKWNDSTTWFKLAVPWTAAVNEVLNSADGKTATALTDGWSFVLGSGAGDVRRLDLTGQMPDSTHPGIASFDLDLSTATNDGLVLLVAVIRVGADIALSAAELPDLAFSNASVAVRSVHVFS